MPSAVVVAAPTPTTSWSRPELPGRGRAVVKPERPQNVYVVYPGRPYQVEVYAPSADQARQLVFGGAVRPIAT
jgi:hypothetical protein